MRRDRRSYRPVLVLAGALGAASAGAEAAPVPEGFRLSPPALKAEAAGDRTAVTAAEEGELRVVVVANGKVIADDLIKGDYREVYTQDVLERPRLAARPTRLARVYRVADWADTTGVRTKYPHEGKTVLVERKGGTYALTADGKPLAGHNGSLLADEFEPGAGESPGGVDFLPGKGVKAGDTWPLDSAKVAGWFEAMSGFLVDRDKSQATGKLVRSYDRGGGGSGSSS